MVVGVIADVLADSIGVATREPDPRADPAEARGDILLEALELVRVDRQWQIS